MTDTDKSSRVVELRVLAHPSQLSVVRAVAATIAGQLDFDLDAIADIRLAIDEACSYLVMRAHADTTLGCRFHGSTDGLDVIVSAPTGTSDTSLRQSFGWHVLNTLTDAVDMTQDADPDRPDDYVTTIEFRKSKVAIE